MYHKESLITRLTLAAGYAIPFPEDPSHLRTITLALREHERRGGTLAQVMAALSRQGNRTTEPTLQKFLGAQQPRDYVVGIIHGQTRYLADQAGAQRLVSALRTEWGALIREASAPARRENPGSKRAAATHMANSAKKVGRLAPHVAWIKANYERLAVDSQAEALRQLGLGHRSADKTYLSTVLLSDEEGWRNRDVNGQRVYCAPEAFILDLRARMERVLAEREAQSEHARKVAAVAALPVDIIAQAKANQPLLEGLVTLLSRVITQSRAQDHGTLLKVLSVANTQEHRTFLERIQHADHEGWVWTDSAKFPVSYAAPRSFLEVLKTACESYLTPSGRSYAATREPAHKARNAFKPRDMRSAL